MGKPAEPKTASQAERLGKDVSLEEGVESQVGVQCLRVLLAMVKSLDFTLEQREVIEGVSARG